MVSNERPLPKETDMRFVKFVRRCTSAFKAGMIATSCPHCIVDDETETISPCFLHAERIAELHEINKANWK